MLFVHKIPNLRLGEFDLGGVLYHANYYHLYEMAREALLEEEHYPYHQLVKDGFHLAIAEAHQKFIAPIYYGEPLRITLGFADMKRTSVRAEYEIFAPRENADTLVHTGSTRLAFISNENGRFQPGRFPEKLVNILEKYRCA